MPTIDDKVSVGDCHDHGVLIGHAAAVRVHLIAEQLAGGLDVSRAVRGWKHLHVGQLVQRADHAARVRSADELVAAPRKVIPLCKSQCPTKNEPPSQQQ